MRYGDYERDGSFTNPIAQYDVSYTRAKDLYRCDSLKELLLNLQIFSVVTATGIDIEMTRYMATMSIYTTSTRGERTSFDPGEFDT